MKEEDRRKSHQNFPTMMKTIDPQIQEVQLSPSRKKKKRKKIILCHIIIKLLKTSDNEKIFSSQGGGGRWGTY